MFDNGRLLVLDPWLADATGVPVKFWLKLPVQVHVLSEVEKKVTSSLKHKVNVFFVFLNHQTLFCNKWVLWNTMNKKGRSHLGVISCTVLMWIIMSGMSKTTESHSETMHRYSQPMYHILDSQDWEAAGGRIFFGRTEAEIYQSKV